MSTPSPVLWGVLNVTPDSFSDGGAYLDPEAALAHALAMRDQGASVIDVGGESTRPGASRISLEEETRRVLPVITALASAGVTVSVDTMNSATAQAAIDAGASIVNDVSGGLADSAMASVVAKAGVDYAIMHWRAHSDVMQDHAHYDDVVAEVTNELRLRVDAAVEAGIDPDRIIVDPGLGFAKTPEHNWALLARIEAIVGLGHRVLVGASRKRFLGELIRYEHEPADRDGVSSALAVALAGRGVWGFRVHNPLIHAQALEVWQAVERGGTR